MSENLNTGVTAEAWADIVIKEWIHKAGQLGIAPYSPLNLERFTHHVITNSGGDPVKIEFTYDYFLNFVDWGVGNKVKLEDRNRLIRNGKTTRKQKPWFTDVFYKQLKILTHLMAEKNAKKSAVIISKKLI